VFSDINLTAVYRLSIQVRYKKNQLNQPSIVNKSYRQFINGRCELASRVRSRNRIYC